MQQQWLASGAAGGVQVEGLNNVRRGAGARVRIVVEGQVRLAVLGDCSVTEEEMRAAPPAASGRWAELTHWTGSYWVVADNGHQRFVCGDLAGIRPVYYSLRKGRVEWATQVRLLADGMHAAPDLGLLAAQLTVGEQHWPHRTPYEQVRQVPGGYGLLLTPGTPPQLVDVSDACPAVGLREGARRFGKALTEAVQHRLHAAEGPVGADLSGGLDSSTAVMLAAEVGRVRAVTYTDGYTSGEDMAFAARVARHPAITHTVATGTETELPFSFPARQPTASEPVLEAAMFAMDAAYLHPVRDLALHLTGHGGDVVLDSSSACWVRLIQDGHRREARRQVVAFARLRNAAPGPYWKALTRAAGLGRVGALAEAADTLERGPVTPATRGGWSWCRPGPAASWLTTGGRRQVAVLVRQAMHTRQPDRADTFDQWAALRAVGASARGWMPYGDALDIRPVHPYLDNQVVRAAFAVPALARRGMVAYKPLLAAALPQLPAWLTSRRSKGSFTAQRIAGLARNHDRLDALISHSPLVSEGLIDLDAVRQALAEAARGQSTHAIADLHQLVVTCWWLTGHTDAPQQRATLGVAC
ncbi:asparagine synthase-related protein [Streptomyces sp. I05A-00742]|uniref:asparagine synthase-related protein n=1 Tax=Streptomyces sp. I05A-00742 TaxID=2732853 RepID=UPI001489F26B|nr:asparagine synthase-related protein [Streptomyces sp. I05A-00742]